MIKAVYTSCSEKMKTALSLLMSDKLSRCCRDWQEVYHRLLARIYFWEDVECDIDEDLDEAFPKMNVGKFCRAVDRKKAERDELTQEELIRQSYNDAYPNGGVDMYTDDPNLDSFA